jgi:hypothetical protein
VAERKNRSIEEFVKAMMNDQNLSMFLWGEAVMTVVYVHNRSSHQILKNMTLEEAFSGKKSIVEHLRIFGCPVYTHVPKEKRKKLEPSGKKGKFIGYSESSKAYRIYVPGQQKVEINRDVKFDEKIGFRKSIEDSIDPNDEEEHEGPKEETTCSPKHLNVEPSTFEEAVKKKEWKEAMLEEYQSIMKNDV